MMINLKLKGLFSIFYSFNWSYKLLQQDSENVLILKEENQVEKRFVNRKKKLELLLKQSFQLQEGCETSVDTILSCLGFGAEQQKIVSRHVKELFSWCGLQGVKTNMDVNSILVFYNDNQFIAL